MLRSRQKPLIPIQSTTMQNEEKLEYSIVHWKDSSHNLQVGKTTFDISINDKQNSTTISSRTKLNDLFEGLTFEDADVVINRETLRPITANGQFRNLNDTIDFVTTYKKNKISVEFVENGEQNKWVKKVPYYVFDNYQLLISLRSLDFTAKEISPFYLVNPLSMSVVEVECKIIGQEHVSIASGDYECYRVCLQVYEPYLNTQYAFYVTDPPHHLIKAIKGALVYELVS